MYVCLVYVRLMYFRLVYVPLVYIPNSINVVLGIRKLLFGGHSSKALRCVPYAQMPNAQLLMTNCQSNLF